MKRSNKAMIVIAALAGVALLTSDAQAQRRGGFGRARGATFLIGAPEVQEDLKLTDAQRQELDKLAEEAREKRRSLLQDIPNREERIERARELNEQAEDAINKVLNEEQQKRFAQIQLQQAGRADLPGTLLRDAVASKLELTAEQKQKLDDIRIETANARRELFQSFRDANQEERREIGEKLREATEQANEKAQAALTGEQKQAWSDMLGTPLEIQFRRRRGRDN